MSYDWKVDFSIGGVIAYSFREVYGCGCYSPPDRVLDLVVFAYVSPTSS